jgi:hypothetical protein
MRADVALIEPLAYGRRDALWPVIAAKTDRPAMPLDERLECVNDVSGRQAAAAANGQALASELIDHRQTLKPCGRRSSGREQSRRSRRDADAQHAAPSGCCGLEPGAAGAFGAVVSLPVDESFGPDPGRWPPPPGATDRGACDSPSSRSAPTSERPLDEPRPRLHAGGGSGASIDADSGPRRPDAR